MGFDQSTGWPWQKPGCIRYLSSWVVDFLHAMGHLQHLVLPSYILTCFLPGEKGVHLKSHMTVTWPQEHVWGMVFALPAKAGKGMRHIACGFKILMGKLEFSGQISARKKSSPHEWVLHEQSSFSISFPSPKPRQLHPLTSASASLSWVPSSQMGI